MLPLLALSGFFFAQSHPVTVTQSPPSIDGRLDDAVWKVAEPLTGFSNFEPIEDEPMSQETIVRIARDERNLYISFDCRDSEASRVRATFADRDAIFNDDWVMVVLDPFEDERRGVLLLANAYGIQADLTHDDSNGGNEDATWDALWYSAGERTPTGFTVEMSIPFGSLRFDPAHDGWGFNVVRKIARDGQKGSWAPVRAAGGPLLHQDAELTGMRGLSQGMTLGLIPELTVRGGPAIGDAKGSLARTGRGDGPWGGRGAADLGLTGRVSRAGSALDVTVHPDFSQVESDPAKISVNQRFALFYDEKRPFFLEGRSSFLTPETIVYTRTIVDPIFGLKLTSKQGPTQFAILNAVDRDPAPSLVDPRWSRAAYGDDPALTTAVRIASDVGAGTTMGLVATDKHVGGLWNRVVGFDTTYAKGSFSTQDQVMWSYTDHPGHEGERGDAQRLGVNWFTRHVGLVTYLEAVSSGFRAESGFVPRVGFINPGGDVYYRWETGRKTGLLAARFGATVDATESHTNDDNTRDFKTRVRFEMPSTSFWLHASAGTERFSGEDFEKQRLGIEMQSAPSGWINFYVYADAGDEILYDSDDPFLGSTTAVNFTSTLQPLDRWNIALGYDRKAFVDGGAGASLNQFVTRGEESTVFDASVANISTTFFFTHAASVRVFARYDDVLGKVGYSALASWRPSPGTVTYLGYQGSSMTKENGESPDDRAVFFKLSWLFHN